MKARLKMSRREMAAFCGIVAGFARNITTIDTLANLQEKEALTGLVMKLMTKLTTAREKNTITLSELETLVVWAWMDRYAHKFPPYEMALCLQWKEAMNRQQMEAATRYMVNMDINQIMG